MSDVDDHIDSRIRAALDNHESRLKKMLDEHFQAVKVQLSSAFPDGDPVGHRIYHETQLKYMQSRIQLWTDIRNKTIVGVVWAVILALFSASIEYVKMKLGIKP